MKLPFRLLLLSACCRLSGLVSEKPQVIGSHVPIQAAVGEDVILPCHLEPESDVRKLKVKWTHNETTVHKYRSLGDDPDSQDERFKKRTRLFHDEMVRGNISLNLSYVTEQDKGIYTCSVHNHTQVIEGNVTLEVVQTRERGGRKGDPTSGPGTTQHENNLIPSAIVAIVSGVIVFVIVIVIRTGINFQ